MAGTGVSFSGNSSSSPFSSSFGFTNPGSASSAPSFGLPAATTPSVSTAAPSFGVGSGTPSSTPFAFGTGATSSSASAPSFGFGSNPSPASAPSFGFASNPSAASSASPFGASSAFGSSAATPNLFGSGSGNVFGTSTGGAPTSGIFGSSASGAASSPFGSATPTPAPSTPPPSSSPFGAPSNFGSPATGSSNLFGSGAPTPSLFGNTSSAAVVSNTTTPSLFGSTTPTTASAFGSGLALNTGKFGSFTPASTAATTAPAAPQYGATTTHNLFGSSATASTGSNLFGANSGSTPGLFASSTALFGSTLSVAPSTASSSSSSPATGFSFPSSVASSSALSVSSSAIPATGFSFPSASPSVSAAPGFSLPTSSASAASAFSFPTASASTNSSAGFPFLKSTASSASSASATTTASSAPGFSFSSAPSLSSSSASTNQLTLFSTVTTTTITSASAPASTSASAAGTTASSGLTFPALTMSAPGSTPSTSTSGFTGFGVASTPASTAGSSSSFSLSMKSPATAASSSQAQSTVALPSFGVSLGTSSAAQTSSTLVAASSSGAAPASSTAPATTPASTPKLPSEITGRTVEEIIKEWNAELQERTGKFRKQANAIAEWDRRVLQNRDILLSLESEVAKVVETQGSLERQLELIETHQDEVDKALQSMEEEAERLYKEERGLLLDDDAASTRDAMYEQAEVIERGLEQMTEQIKSIINTLNATQMAAPSSSGSTSMTSNSNFDGCKPLWRYVTVSSTTGGGGGGVEWQCNFCHTKKKTTYTQVVNHLLQRGQGIKACPKVTQKDTAEMMKLIEVEERKQAVGASKFVPLPPSTMFSSEVYKGFDDSKKRKGNGGGSTSTPLGKAFNIQGRDTLNALIARFFYASGLPFHLARSPYYAACFSYAANNNLAGYIPPGYNKLRQSLLQQEKANVERLLLPIKSTWAVKGVSIVSDGWSDSQRRPLINFMAVTESGPMFLRAVDCSGVTKDKHFIFTLMKEVIEEVGPQNVVQIITDNARNCMAAGGLVEGLYPHIVWTPCVVHTLNLALQNICAAKNVENNQETYEMCSWISDIAADAMMIKNFIMNHGQRLAMFNSFSPLKLLSVAPTRFASVIVMLKRIKLLKRSLCEMVISEKWDSYREDDVEKAMAVKLKVLDDMWWDRIDYILSFTAPLYDMIRACDTDKPCLHLVYDMWDTMIEKVKREIYKHERIEQHESSNFFDVVHAILVSRWNKNNTSLHCLAHSLNPRYYSAQWLNEDPSRVAPHRDNEVAKERSKCLKKYFPDLAQRRIVIMEFANFSSMSADFADPDSIAQRYELDPKSWWVIYGPSAPTLQGLALKLLVQPSSSSCAERNWSTYSFVHSLRRNKLSTQRAEDLVFIHSNLRLLSRKTPEYLEGETKLWDIGGDKFGTFEDVGDLEIADLSLDEPELERVVFDEDGNEDDLEDEEEGEEEEEH